MGKGRILRSENDGHVFPEPGKYSKAFCGVCGEEMDVHRNVFGPTGFAEAMSKHGHRHDAFNCPNSETAWHEQAVKIRNLIRTTPSREIAKLLEREFAEIIKKKSRPRKLFIDRNTAAHKGCLLIYRVENKKSSRWAA